MTNLPEQNEEFVGYPENYIVGVFGNREAVEAAAMKLAEAGCSDDCVMFFAGKTGADAIDSQGTKHGVLQAIERTIEQIVSDEGHMRTYEDAVRRGEYVLGAHAADEEDRERALAIFKEHNAYNVNYFGRLVVETLVP